MEEDAPSDYRFPRVTNLRRCDTAVLYNQVFVDKLRLERNITKILEFRQQVSLGVLIENYPLEEGLVELITYFTIAEENRYAFIDENELEIVIWTDHNGLKRSATMPRIMFQKRKNDND